MPKPSSPVIWRRWTFRNQRSVNSRTHLENIDGIAHIELDEEDVVRHRLVKHILRAYNKEYEKPARLTGQSL